MESLSYAMASADKLHTFVHAEIKATDNKVTNSKEATEAKAAKARAISAINNTVMLVDGTLAKLRSLPSRQEARPKTSRVSSVIRTTPSNNVNASEALAKARLPGAFAATSALPPNAQSLVTSMSADSKSGLGSQVQSLQDMATSIEPIVKNFDEVLSKPYLDQFSATLNTVPVVGVKNNQIMYLATQQDTLSKTGTKDVWTFFSAFPTDATVTPESNVHFFPYKGDFCVSVGAAIWRRRHRTPDDPILKQAVGNWPKMYLDDWEKIGDNAFPAADIRDVIPFAVLSADRNQIGFNLLTLGQDSSVQILTKDDIYASNTWSAVSYSKGTNDPASPPKWTRMAYWNNNVVALDDQNNSWNLTIDFDASTYKIADKTAIDATSEFTATDIGPVTVRSDGFLYKRYVQQPPSDGADPKLLWSKWVAQDGVTRLGVASPGVLLNLQVLTRTLKSRYIDTQMALYPVVNKINAFAVTHNSYLDLLNQAADDWANAPDDQKQADAIKAGKGFVTHAKIWAKILNTSIFNTKDTVNIMTSQLHDVKSQLQVQLQLLRDKLTGLQNTLNIQQESLGKLRAAFWGAVAAMFLGMALGVLALASGVGAWAVVGAGALFVAGLVAVVALGVLMGDLAGEVSKTEAQINVTNTAITELSSVVKSFTDLDTLYGTLNVFWGRMANDANSLASMDEATAAQLGIDVLEDKSSIIAAQKVTSQIAAAATTYLDTLNKQGINIPQGATLMALAREAPSGLARAVSLKTSNSLESEFHKTVERANSALAEGDSAAYEKLMEAAFNTEILKSASITMDRVRTGVWYDIPSISGASQLFNNGSLLSASVANLAAAAAVGAEFNDPSGIENRIKSAGPVLVGMLHKTDATCQDVQNLLQRYKELDGNQSEIAKLKDTLLETAINDCIGAQTYSARANNAFVDVNNAATDYQQDLERQVTLLGNNQSSERASADERKRDISIPWYVYLGGAVAIFAYTEKIKSDIENDLQNKLRQLDESIAALKQLENSGATIDGHSATWIEMVRTISGCLGGVYNILTAIQGQVMEDPSMYEVLLDVEWANIQKNTTDVLNILASRGIDVNSSEATLMALAAPDGSRGSFQSISSITPPAGSNADVVKALRSPGSMDTTMKSQATQAKQFFAEMETLMQSPYLSGIVGYWDVAQTDKTSLLDVVNRLRRQYVDMMSNEYPVVENLYTTALLQETRAELVMENKLSLEILVRSSLRSARSGQKAANVAGDKFRAASADYVFALKQVQANLDQIKAKMGEIDKNIGDLKKQERDMIISLIADVVALAFASAVLLASFGFLGPVAAALTTAQAIGLGATATAAAIKTVIDSLKLADIEALITTLQSTKRDLDATYNGLNTIRPLFKNVVTAAEGMEATTTAMADGLQHLANDIELLKLISLTEDDVKSIGGSWVEVKNACTTWMDIVNAQGIVPATF
ncbi:hypothetical protein G7046_g2637 [Stylonectria norvegica]|nr:hypothetical protein G7046_g2637 [Stylonectria norvegica]